MGESSKSTRIISQSLIQIATRFCWVNDCWLVVKLQHYNTSFNFVISTQWVLVARLSATERWCLSTVTEMAEELGTRCVPQNIPFCTPSSTLCDWHVEYAKENYINIIHVDHVLYSNFADVLSKCCNGGRL